MSHVPLLAFAPTGVCNETGSGILLLTNCILGAYASGFLSHLQAAKYKFYQYLANAGLMIELFIVIGQAA